jgi:hypothetical protein
MKRASLEQVATQLHLSLPPLERNRRGYGTFDEWIEPAEILDPESSVVWGGMMLPDAIPLLGDGSGDAILARFAPDGSFVELVKWSHEGCLWHPTDVVPGLASPVAELERTAGEALTSGLKRYCREWGGARLAEVVEVPWPTLSRWLVDVEQIDLPSRARICQATSSSEDALFRLDWERAESAASAASTTRPDLAWPGAVLGRAAERRGDGTGAREWYRRSLAALQTTGAFTEAWSDPGSPFAVSRLSALGLVPPADDRHLEACLKSDSSAVRVAWIEAGDRHLTEGRPLLAHDCYFRAGWDWHFANDMQEVLERLLQAAEAGKSAAWAALARLHLEALST